MFVDYVEIEVAAGHGGPGCVSFRREKFLPKGGPNGGDGGRGGSIIAQADPQLSTLLDFRYKRRYKAGNGQPGEGGLKSGRSGEDVVLRLPVGTLIKDLDEEILLGDLDSPGSELVLAKGGIGGRGNTHFKSPTRQAPRYAQDGTPGEQRRLALELKLLADVGLVGLPNAGKSTILATFSAARPKVADYPFTTLVPNLGIVKLREFKSCVMADIPGLVEGASHGKGLGHQFLRHIQRTRLIVYVVDINEEDIEVTREQLKQELADFDQSLTDRPTMTAITKTDTVSQEQVQEISDKHDSGYVFMSAVAHQGTDRFLNEIERKLEQC